MATPVDAHPTILALYHALGDGLLHGDDPAYWLLTFIEAGALDLATLDDLVRDTDDGPGWSALFDIDRTPAQHLRWIGQFVGVQMAEGLAEADKRQRVRSRESWQRGTVAAMRRAIEVLLSGTKDVIITERDTSPYHFAVATYQAETPDQTAVDAAIRRQKPGGLQYTYSVRVGQAWSDIDTKHATWDAVRLAYPTWDDAHTTLP